MIFDASPVELTKDEKFVIEQMRKYGPYAEFFIEKKPEADRKEGKLVRIKATQAIKLDA